MEISRENSANLAGEEKIQSVFMLVTISHVKYFTLQSKNRFLSGCFSELVSSNRGKWKQKILSLKNWREII